MKFNLYVICIIQFILRLQKINITRFHLFNIFLAKNFRPANPSIIAKLNPKFVK